MPTPDLRLFGIRHHGPGSAASLRKALDEFRPDIVLLECPADGEAAVQTIIRHPDLRLPVALLLYDPKQYQQASFLPFATFSPETQALRYCHEHGAHLRCMDLPAALRLANEELGMKNWRWTLRLQFPQRKKQKNRTLPTLLPLSKPKPFPIPHS